MRQAIVGFLMVVGAASAAYAADDLPKRKLGLGEVTVDSDGVSRSMRQCVNADTDDELRQMGSQMGQNCARQEVRKEGAAYVSEAECTMAGSTITARTVFTGDFTSNYQGDVTAKYNPPLLGKSEGKTKITARWIGPCEPSAE